MYLSHFVVWNVFLHCSQDDWFHSRLVNIMQFVGFKQRPLLDIYVKLNLKRLEQIDDK